MSEHLPEPIWQDATTLCRDLQRGAVTATALMANVYARIKALNPHINALVELLPGEQAMALATAADKVPVAERGPLHGLPMAPKDAVAVAGFATSWGFEPFSNRIESADDELARRMRNAGAIFIGHSNMPEFGLGSHTFNELYGNTYNPYDLSKTPGGSSGGAAAALAADLLPLADGSDLGGSLRNPASFCNVVGLRPSIGRMPFNRGLGWYGRMVTTGPMAKTVADTTLLFSVIAGPDAGDPLTLSEPGVTFLDALVPFSEDALSGLRIGYSTDLGSLQVDLEVAQSVREAAQVMADLGASTTANAPDLEGAMDAFQVQRAATLRLLAKGLEKISPQWRDMVKDTARWNMEKGLALSAEDLIQAELQRTAVYQRVAAYFQDHDALILPAAQVPPFPADQDWVSEINGVSMPTYIDWMAICCMISVTGLPTISVPGGFTRDGLPLGIQIVGKPRGDLQLLRLAQAFEAATQFGKRRPDLQFATR
ncbi:MAG TPA: amidase [Gammaproteobacteria bacterium]|nr:amidase [Gammaproteobacteria bacterium]